MVSSGELIAGKLAGNTGEVVRFKADSAMWC